MLRRDVSLICVVLALAACAGPLEGQPAVNPPQAASGTVLEQAFSLDEGKTVRRDAAAAAALYEAAAKAGEPLADLRLGYLYETGDGVPQDYGLARVHYQLAADAGVSEARMHLAICHLEGWGGSPDREAFAREMRAAAEAGYAPAQQIMAEACQLGLGVPKDPAAAVAWLEAAAKSGNAEAQYHLGTVKERRRALALMPDMKLARTWYQLSAEKEYLASMRAMARTFLASGRDQRDFQLGQKWLQMATDNGDAEAPYILAASEMLHVDAPGRDVGKAEAWLKLASERGNERATEVLQLAAGGRSLPEALRYVLHVPFEERYTQRLAAHRSDAPSAPPQIYRVVRPVYPLALRMTGTTGEVVVDFVVDTTGRVQNPYAISSTHPLLSDRAVEAVRQWRFFPGRRDGRVVNTHMQAPVIFVLSDEQLEGVDGLLAWATTRAEELGAAVIKDASDLRPARALNPVRLTKLPDGTPVPPDARGVVLLVLDQAGIPQRAHILSAQPEAFAPALLQAALAARYQSRLENGQPVPGNVVLSYSAKKRDRVLK